MVTPTLNRQAIFSSYDSFCRSGAKNQPRGVGEMELLEVFVNVAGAYR
jgi:hypothetical protein